jgi:hypothetical protein
MLFGDESKFAIEVGRIIDDYGGNGPYIQFRFVISGVKFGDWEDRIPLLASIEIASEYHSTKNYRQVDSLADVTTDLFFQRAFDTFYNSGLSVQPIVPNLRDRHHVSEIGMAALTDKVGVAVADFSSGDSRLVVKDLRENEFLMDQRLRTTAIENACNEYINWGRRAFPR